MLIQSDFWLLVPLLKFCADPSGSNEGGCLCITYNFVVMVLVLVMVYASIEEGRVQ